MLALKFMTTSNIIFIIPTYLRFMSFWNIWRVNKLSDLWRQNTVVFFLAVINRFSCRVIIMLFGS